MKRMFAIIMAILLTFGIFRRTKNAPPLTLSSFLEILSEVDIDFDNTQTILDYIQGIKNNFQFKDFDDEADGLKQFFNLVAGFFKVLVAPVYVLVMVLMDVGSLISTVLGAIYKLMGEVV